MKIMLRRDARGLSVYVPRKDLEEPVIAQQHDALWGGWVKLKNGWVLELPVMDAQTQLPITVNARKLEGEGS
ncbi:putative nitrogen fixation protein NifT [Komagataeibacter swingsii]|uniref:Putative nitrogen fixation protein NifT n=1 Tax=Komagataeibacter swingsii TaxID=215220 RepID=A0A2V4RJ08_9PROT|nr:putative nitrogen fixation protein NifT [Komagataeibacter swingsii]PYD68964.1 putative nitrogen fixation protein NifT [Komagataeibacter swingsii]GBQ63680.1 nitrogen fixation protein [Komagataeibacter swingsii DSM 16373]